VLDAHAAGATLGPGEVFTFQAGSGGGWGDPLDRDPDDVGRDVRIGRYGPEDAAAVYGVVVTGAGGAEGVDHAATERRRAAARAERLATARPAAGPIDEPPVPHAAEGADGPLYHGIVRRGDRAVAVASGAVLARAPAHWTDGCPTIEEERRTARWTGWLQRTYLDPLTGRSLAVEAVPLGWGRAFTSAPAHWADRGPAPSA
jgi:N-methylhydantoinase B